jgi:hypothetical protein
LGLRVDEEEECGSVKQILLVMVYEEEQKRVSE